MTETSLTPRGAAAAFSDFDDWFSEVLDETRPSLVVGIARAAIRVLQIHATSIPYVPVVSHHALPFLRDDVLKKRNILLFDDSVVFGSTLKHVRDYLLERGAAVSCAAYVVDRSSFRGDSLPGARTQTIASPHSAIPLRYKHLLWPPDIRRHHDALVRAILGSLNHYNFDFPTFRVVLASGLPREPIALKAKVAELRGIRDVYEVSSVASTENNIFRYTALVEPERQGLFDDHTVNYRSYLKLRALFAPSLGEARFTSIPQLTIRNNARFGKVRFRDARLNELWNTLQPPREGDPWYHQALLRLLGIFVGICIGAPLVDKFTSSLQEGASYAPVDLLEDELQFMTGEENCSKLESGLSTLLLAGRQVFAETIPIDHQNAALEPEDVDLTTKVKKVWSARPQLKPDSAEPLYSAASKALLSLREATDTPQLRRLTPDMSRLEVGLTFRDFHELLTQSGLSVSEDEVTLAIDLCVDNGQAVPKVVCRNSQWLRAFYSGEAFNSHDVLQLELAIAKAYAEFARKSSRLLSPFDLHKMCVLLKDVLPWLPISSRYYTFGKQALIGRDRDELIPVLAKHDHAPLRIKPDKEGYEVLEPNPNFHPAVQAAWDSDRSRDFYDGFEYLAAAFAKMPDEVKLLLSTCGTHRKTYNSVAFEAHSWVYHKHDDFTHFLANIQPSSYEYGTKPNVSPNALEELYWSIQYLIEAEKKLKVFDKFAWFEQRAAQAFRRLGASAERFWLYKVHSAHVLDPTVDPEIKDRFGYLLPLIGLMKALTSYTVRILEETGALSRAALSRIFAKHHAPMPKAQYSWVTDWTIVECARYYNKIAEAPATPGRSTLKTRLPLGLSTADADWFRSVYATISTATEEIRQILNEYCPHYNVEENDFPYSPVGPVRHRDDGSVEKVLRDVYILTMDIIGSTNDERTGEFKDKLRSLLTTWIKDRGYVERTGNDMFVVCAQDPQLLWEIAKRAKVEGETAARSASKNLGGLRKALSCGTVVVIQYQDGGCVIRDAFPPHIIPRATGLLEAVDKFSDMGRRNSVIAIEDSTVDSCQGRLGIVKSEGKPAEVKAKHVTGTCLLFSLDQ